MTTYHSIKRAQKRAGLCKTAAIRLIENAIERGQKPGDFDCKEREYLQRKAKRSGEQAVVYNGYCFIISVDGACITMFSLPDWFGKKRYYNKAKPRSAKAIIREYIYAGADYDLLDCMA